MASLTVAVQVVTFVAFLLVTAAVFRLVIDSYLGRSVDSDSSLRFGLRFLAPAAWISLLAGIVVGGGFVVCGLASWALGVGLVPGLAVFLLPALYLAIVWSLAVPALLGENLRGRAALRRSAALVRARFWPSVGVLALTSLLAGVASAVITILLTAFVGTDAGDSALFVDQGVANLVSFTVVLPFEAAVTTVLYVDLRVRVEGFAGGDDVPAAPAEGPAGA